MSANLDPSRAHTIREVPAVRRAIAILFHLGRQQQPVTLSQVARDLDIIPSSCLHILRELAAAGFVVADGAAKTYTLGPAVLQLASDFRRGNRFVDVARPHLARLASEFQVDVSAHQTDGQGHLQVVATSEGMQGVEVRMPLGHRFPLLAGAAGRCIAAFNDLPDAELKARFQEVRWQTSLSFARWREQVAQTRETGVGVDDGWYRKGLTTIAAPVRGGDAGAATRFIGALFLTEQLTATMRRQLIAGLRSTAARIGAELNGGVAAAA